MAERLLYDALSSFAGGVNSDVEPLLLDRNTLSWMVNGTVRGGYAKPRPPIFNREIVFPSDEVETAITTGLFQGAGYYRPDFGSSQLVAQISGRLFAFAVNGDTLTATEVTVPGDPNNPTVSQVWMFQAEKWLIVTDGTSALPIFYDGVTSRRSYGPSVVLGVATAFSPANPPPIGDVVTLTLNDPYTGPYNVPVLFNGEYYLVLESSTPTPGYGITLKPGLLPTSPITFNAGSEITADPSILGYCYSVGIDATRVFIRLVTGSNIPVVGETISAGGYSFVITGKVTPGGSDGGLANATTYEIRASKAPGMTLAILEANVLGRHVTRVSTDPIVGLGTLISGVTIGAFDPEEPATLSLPYSGPAGQTVYITDSDGNVRLLTIEASSAPPPSNTLYLQNLTDTSADPYVNPSNVLSVPELPPGRMGAYGIGHVALCLVDGHSYIYGDVVGGPSGTAIYNYRDAVLKTTENDFLAGGGSFRIPNTGELITSFTIAPVLDASYGQGPLQIGTPISVYTCDIPTSPQAFEDLTNPILTQALIGKGPVSQNGTIIANSDTLYRSGLGFDSLIYGRRDFQTGWGNTPISTEVNRSIEGEDKSLISFTSAATFDNRLLATVQMASSSRGIYSQGIVALNFDPVSSLRGKAPSIWEGEWEDGNVMQYVTGNFSGVERCFQFAFNPETLQIEIWEQLRSDSAEKFDNGTDRITWSIETPCIFHPDKRSADLPIVRLANGKIHLDEVSGTVDVAVQYRPDYSATWVDWHSFTVSSATPDGYKTPIGLGEPRVNSCAPENNRPSRSGRFFQLKITVTGQAKIMGFEAAACQEPTVLFPPPVCS